MDLFSLNYLEPTYKKDLLPINNLKVIFRPLRDYFAGNSTGITRDETIAKNLMRVLFCKIYDEQNTNDTEKLKFVFKKTDSNEDAFNNLSLLFQEVKKEYSEIFNADDSFDFNISDAPIIMKGIQGYKLLDADRDIIADAFEELIGTTFRGSNGQFFTPRNIVQMIIDIIQPKQGEKILDPACGTGGFLAYVTRSIEKNENTYIYGIDKDSFVSKLAKTYLTLLGNFKGNVFCENSLDTPNNWNSHTQQSLELGSIDIILSNPPFGAKIPIIGDSLLNQYELGHIWDKKNNKWLLTSKLQEKQPPQILFIERIVQFLKDGGRAAIVLPDGCFGNPTDSYIWEYLKKYVSVIGIISLSHETFQPSTHTKTSVLFIEKKVNSRKNIFMAIANNIGHNKNGKEVYKIDAKTGKKVLDDDTPVIAKNFKKFLNDKYTEKSVLGFSIPTNKIQNNIYVPESYWKTIEIEDKYIELKQNCNEITIKDLEDKGVIEIKRGNEIGSNNYGKGNIPFIRTTDIVSWEIKKNKAKSVTTDIYNKYKKAQDIKENDILFVNDGTFLIGNTAMVSSLDTLSLYQSHIRKIRVNNNEFGITSYYLFYLLNTDYVQHQIKAKTFIQATLSTLGNRLSEINLPILKDKDEIDNISNKIKDIIDKKTQLRKEINKLFS